MSAPAAAPRPLTGRWSVWRYGWLIRHKLVLAVERARRHARGRMLDIGCGARSFEPLFAGQVECYVGADLPVGPYLGTARPHVYARCEALPFRDGSMDSALAISVMNYLPEPSRLLEEAHRVLRPGGVLLVELTQMQPDDELLHDYFRFTRRGGNQLLERAGFEAVEWIPIGGLMTRVGMSTIARLKRLNRGWWRALTELPVRALYILLQLWFEALDRVWNDPREVLGHLVVARRK